MREFSYTGSIHFRQFPATLVLWQKGPLPQDEGNYFTLDYHFRQFPATLVYVAEKPPPPRMREFFLHWIYPFQVISSNFGFCGRKAPPHPHQDEGNFFTLDLSISGNFQQLWFLWQKAPSPRMREIFLHWIYPFQAIWAMLDFVAEKPPPPQDEGNLFTLDLSISGNFQQLWILCQKTSPPLPLRMREIILHWIYPFQAISSNFGFCGRKVPPRMR